MVGISLTLDSLCGLEISLDLVNPPVWITISERDVPFEIIVGLDPKSIVVNFLPTLLRTLVEVPPVPPVDGVGPTEQLSKFI